MNYDLAQTSLVKTPISLAEMYIPLWIMSSYYCSSTFSPYGSWVAKGGSVSGTYNSSVCKLHTLNINWLATTKFAFEASIWSVNTAVTTKAIIWDITTNLGVIGSEITTTSATPTLVRSGQFTLIPGHIYGVGLGASPASNAVYLTKAHLIAFLS